MSNVKIKKVEPRQKPQISFKFLKAIHAVAWASAIIGLILTANYFIMAWTEPTQAPPGDAGSGFSFDWPNIQNRPSGLDDGDDVGLTNETDPSVGSVENGKWCTGNESQHVICTSDAPGGADTPGTLKGACNGQNPNGNFGTLYTSGNGTMSLVGPLNTCTCITGWSKRCFIDIGIACTFMCEKN